MTCPEIQLYIDGHGRSAPGAPISNPADGLAIGAVPRATKADLDDALAAAERGLRCGAKRRRTRAQIILRASALIRFRVEETAVAMTMEQGKPLDQARLDMLRLRHHRMGRD